MGCSRQLFFLKKVTSFAKERRIGWFPKFVGWNGTKIMVIFK